MRTQEIDRVLAGLGAVQHGVFAGSQAKARGITDTMLKHRRKGRWLLQLKRDIYRLRDHPWTWEAQLQALLLDAGPLAVVSHRSAAQLHHCYRYRHMCAVEVTGPAPQDHHVTLGKLHRSTLIPQGHRTVINGFPVTTLARTCFDLIGDPDPGLRRSPQGKAIHAKVMGRVVNDALARRGLTLGQLAAVRTVLGGRGRSGTVLARELMAKMGPKFEAPASDSESLLQELIDAYGISDPERQVQMSDEQGWIGKVDFLWRAAMLIIEVDSRWHDGPLDIEDDAEKDRRYKALGYEVWRVRYPELVLDSDRVVRRLTERLANSGPISTP